MRRLALAFALLLASIAPGAAQDFVARAVPGAAEVAVARDGAVELTLPLSHAVPFRVFTRSDPPKLIVDTAEVDWSRLDAAPFDGVGAPRTGRVAPGWTRLVLPLEAPVTISRAWMDSVTPAIRIETAPGAGPDGPLLGRAWDLPAAVAEPVTRPRQMGDRPLVVALDPGHGGIDPGAMRDGESEAALMLGFARELAERLRRAGHEVLLTRERDEFVALRGRPAIARAGGADLLISLHADAVAGGGAQGATVYTLADAPADELSAELVARQGHGDLLLGVDLPEAGDEIAQILMELARAETAPRSDALAQALVDGIGAAGIALHKRPRLGADFTVLKSPDIPSVLLEVGFMSSPADLANLRSSDWRARMATAILRGIEAWAVADAAEALRLRQ